MRSVVLALGLLLPLFTSCQPSNRLPNEGGTGTKRVTQSPNLRLAQPVAGGVVSSPLRVKGEARGGWFFEATFPLSLRDGNGNTIGASYVTAQGEWMTKGFVPFTGEIRFDRPETATGALVLRKANPSGLPEYDEEVVVSVRFARE